jgi:hypothetical protein
MFSGISYWLAEVLLLSRRAGELGMLVEDEVVLEPAWNRDDAIDASGSRSSSTPNTESAPQGMFFVDVHAATQ